jgi:hypothetical protein
LNRPPLLPPRIPSKIPGTFASDSEKVKKGIMERSGIIKNPVKNNEDYDPNLLT